jgi:hypothetical protein
MIIDLIAVFGAPFIILVWSYKQHRIECLPVPKAPVRGDSNFEKEVDAYLDALEGAYIKSLKGDERESVNEEY